MTSSRSFLIDFTKALAMILVIVQHCWSMLSLDTDAHGLVCYAYRAIVNCGVPLFVVISGMLILHKPAVPLREFYLKRLPRLIYPWLLWALVVYVVSLFTHAYDWYDGRISTAILQFIPCLLTNRVNEFHWFVHMILALYLLAPFLQRMLAALSRREVAAILIVWAVSLVLQPLFPSLFLLGYIGTLWRYLGVFIAGYYLRLLALDSQSSSIRLTRRHLSLIGLALFVLSYIVDVLTHCHFLLTEPLTAIFIALWLTNAESLDRTPRLVRTPMTNISRFSYMIYLVHIPVIRALYLALAKVWTCPDPLLPLMPLAAALVVLPIVYTACLLCDRLRWIPNSVFGIG